MRIVNWNIEYMNTWFVPNSDKRAPAFRQSYKGKQAGGPIRDVTGLAERVGAVLRQLDPDLICLQEGAGEEEVSLFLNRYLSLANRKSWQVIGGSGNGQKLIAAARTDRKVSSISLASNACDLTKQLSSGYRADIDGDLVAERKKFARVPLVVDVKAHGREIRIVNCHLKSKRIENGEKLWRGSVEEKQRYIRAALTARRRISAEAFRIRAYLDDVFHNDPKKLLLLVGDLNDGPGFDYFEKLYLTHSIIDVVFGSVLRPEGRLAHPLIVEGTETPVSAYFNDFVEGINDKPLLLDHAGVSPELAGWRVTARVATKEFDAQKLLDRENSRESRPSDHRPIVVDIEPSK